MTVYTLMPVLIVLIADMTVYTLMPVLINASISCTH